MAILDYLLSLSQGLTLLIAGDIRQEGPDYFSALIEKWRPVYFMATPSIPSVFLSA